MEGGRDPEWAPTSRVLYYTHEEGQVWEVDLTTEEHLANPRPRILFESSRQIGNLEVAADGERFLVRCRPRETPPIQLLLRGRP